MENLVSCVVRWIEVTSSVVAILSFISGLVVNRLANYFKYYKLRKTLYKEKLAFQIIPSEISSNMLGYPLRFIPKIDFERILKTNEMLRKIKSNVVWNLGEPESGVNTICIGFGTNEDTMCYLRKLIPQFIWINDSDQVGFRYGTEANDIIKFNDNGTGYSILIKLTEEDLKCNQTVHLWFGGSAETTGKAVDYFAEHYKDIYQKHKTNHYVIAVPICLSNNSFDFSKGIVDLTEKILNSLPK